MIQYLFDAKALLLCGRRPGRQAVRHMRKDQGTNEMDKSCSGQCVSDFTNSNEAAAASLHYSTRLLPHGKFLVQKHT